MFANIMMILLSFAQAGESVGFSSGKDFKATAIEGQVSVTCEGFNGNGQALFTCRDLVLDPVAYEYVVGPILPQATRIELKATHQDGSSNLKTLAYNGAVGKTNERVNLWISTLFQTPLLDKGLNKISYVIYAPASGGVQEFQRGEFQINVQRGTPRSCQPSSYTSTDLNDCHAQFSVCQRYFQELNYCK